MTGMYRAFASGEDFLEDRPSTDRSDPVDLPPAPENVRVQLDDDTEIPVELIYSGEDDGQHVWTAVTPVPTDRVRRVLCAVLPGHTTVRLIGSQS